MSDQTFQGWRERGYKRLLPILPPHATPKNHGEPGKTPGVLDEDGTWRGIAKWADYHAAEIECARWQEMGANVGLIATEDAFLLDVDAYDPNVARQIEDMAGMLLGPAPKRVGRAPKFALLYRTSEPLRLQVLRFESTPERRAESKLDRVEIPAQAVVSGIHPATKQPYSWPIPAGRAAELTCVSAEQLNGFFGVLRSFLPVTAGLVSGVDRDGIDQEALRGEPELIEKAIRATPNSANLRYEEWVRIAAALRAALPDDQEHGLQLFCEFSERAEHLPERTEDPERVYWSVNPPFGVGAPYLYQLAANTSTFAADRWFEEPTPTEPANDQPRPTGLYSILGVEDLLSRPPQRFILARHVPENSLGFVYGDPGTGKSFILLDWALHMAFAMPDWNGDALTAPGAVAYIAGEGVSGMGQRIRSWMAAHGKAREDIPANRFGLLHESINFMQPTDVVKLADTLRAAMAGPLGLIVVDTVSRALPGADENLQKEMTLFVAACDALKQAFNCCVIGVHHSNKAGDMRGSSVLKGAGDFVFKLNRKKGESVGQLWCEKQKDAPDGWAEDYLFEITKTNNRTSLVLARLHDQEVAIEAEEAVDDDFMDEGETEDLSASRLFA
jgi:hypothetical protein